MTYEIDVVCPECVTRIRRTVEDEDSAYMVWMRNGNYIGMTCPKCGLQFYISEKL